MDAKAHEDYFTITEIAGEHVSQEQVDRLSHRYLWAGQYCAGKDVVEVACGTGPGLSYLASLSRSLEAGDYSQTMVDICNKRLGPSIRVSRFDAQSMPYADASKDVIIMFEALYYVPNPVLFFSECRRVLRPGGVVLIANANKDLYDFNPSPNSHYYLGAAELTQACSKQGFTAQTFGYLSTASVSLRQRILRPIKKLAVTLNLMPTTNDGKKWLKRLVFGRLVPLPADVDPRSFNYVPPGKIPGAPDREHKVIYCCGQKPA